MENGDQKFIIEIGAIRDINEESFEYSRKFQ